MPSGTSCLQSWAPAERGHTPGCRHPHPSCSLAHCLPLGRAGAESQAAKVPVLELSTPEPKWCGLNHPRVAIAAQAGLAARQSAGAAPCATHCWHPAPAQPAPSTATDPG